MARKERYLVGLDVGTSKVTAVVGERLDGDEVDVVGLGVAESRGIRRGVVVTVFRASFCCCCCTRCLAGRLIW